MHSRRDRDGMPLPTGGYTRAMLLINHPGFPVRHSLLGKPAATLGDSHCWDNRSPAKGPGKAGLSASVKHSENWKLTSDPELAPPGTALLGSGSLRQ